MSEQPSIDPVELYRKNIERMSPRQLKNHLRRKARNKKSALIDGAFATILSTIFESSKESGLGGKVESYLR